MEFKKIYEDVIKKVCLANRDDFDNIIEQERPEFYDKLIPNEKAPYNCVFSMKLDESVATEKDYRDFCEYIYNYIGLDIYDYLDQEKRFANFGKKEN